MSGGIAPLALGSIQYINSLPVDLGILSGAVPFEGRVVRGIPAHLNDQLLDGRVHLSPVSSFWCAQHASQFRALPDLSISSESGVRSVLLFSREPLKELSQSTFWVTGEGRTTPVLLEVLCRKFYGFVPKLKVLPGFFTAPPDDPDALLLIGDEALIHRERLTQSGFLALDLADEWKRRTGLGFVFALWAARLDAVESSLSSVAAAYRAILESRSWGERHKTDVLAEAHRRTTLSDEELQRYFGCLSYGLSESVAKGMELYLAYAREYGLLTQPAPLSFLDGVLDSDAKNRYNKAFIPGTS